MASTAELPISLGRHCSYTECKAFDFLPFTCSLCARSHCKEHAKPEQHECAKATGTDNVALDGGSKFEDKFNDLLPDPQRRALDRDAAELRKQQKRDDARAILAKSFGSAAVANLDRRAPPAAGITAASAPSSGKAANPVVTLMKLKQRAIPVDSKSKSLPMDARLFITVEHRRGVEHALISERAVWLNKVSPNENDDLRVINKRNKSLIVSSTLPGLYSWQSA